MDANNFCLIAWKSNEFDKIQVICKTFNRHFVCSIIQHAINDLESVRTHRRELADLLIKNNIVIPSHIKNKL